MTETMVEHRYYPAIFVARVINWVVGIAELFLGLRLLLKLLGADPSSPFVGWVYGITVGMIGPFAGAFPNISLGGPSVIDLVTMMAMIGYAVLGWILTEVLSLIFVSSVRI